jgi:signal transduction histidine kinase
VSEARQGTVAVDDHQDRAHRGEHAPLRRIIDHLADGIIVVDSEGSIRFANPAAELLFGRPIEELVGHAFGFAVGTQETTEIEVVRRGGGVVTVELRIVPTEWEGETMDLVSLRDVTDRKQAEERTRELAHEQTARAEAEAANRAKSEFLTMMSHELRTPLNAILGYCELLALGLSGPVVDAQREQLGRIQASSHHLIGLVNEILDLSKIEAGRLTVNNAPASAAEAISAAATLTQPQAQAAGIALSARSLDDPAPTYLGDEDRARQILVNLLSNAVKFTESGGSITLECGRTSEPDGEAQLQGGREWVYLRVTDSGIGIPEDKLRVIFNPFVQVDTGHTRSRDGTGLGLTISRRLACLMGGDLTARSEAGRGSTFTLWLPTAPHQTERSGEEAPFAEALPVGVPLAGLSGSGKCLLRELPTVVTTMVARIEHDPGIPTAASLDFSDLADHLATLLADIAESLVVLEESAGRPSPFLADATLIQRLVAERHGIQRARLGWTEEAVRREYAILRQELQRTLEGCSPDRNEIQLQSALQFLARFLEQAEYVSVRAMDRAETS